MKEQTGRLGGLTVSNALRKESRRFGFFMFDDCVTSPGGNQTPPSTRKSMVLQIVWECTNGRQVGNDYILVSG